MTACADPVPPFAAFAEPENDMPAGFALLALPGGFQRLFGPICVSKVRPVIAFRIDARHLNRAGHLHGGALAAFSDMQALVLRPPGDATARHMPTISLSTDFLAPVREGEWLEMTIVVTKETGAMVFTDGIIRVGENVVVRTRAIYRKPRNEAVDADSSGAGSDQDRS